VATCDEESTEVEKPDVYVGRPLIPEPLSTTTQKDKSLRKAPSMAYLESGSRWIERQEAHSLRVALEDMDLQEEQRVHEAAQEEASELVLQHRSPAPEKKAETGYRNPDIVQKDYKAHLRKGSYGGIHRQDALEAGQRRTSGSRSPSPTKSLGVSMPPVTAEYEASAQLKPSQTEPDTELNSAQKPHKTKSYQGLANAVARDVASSMRRISSGSRRKFSSEQTTFPFPNPSDRIYEEPEETASDAKKAQEAADLEPVEVPRHVRRNPFARVKFNQEKLERTKTAPVGSVKPFNPVEIQKNPPTQSRRPWYLSNKPAGSPATSAEQEKTDGQQVTEVLPSKDEVEVRSDDIRAATSPKRKDRSTNLPLPTAVSDSPGRPIVSFNTSWRPQDDDPDDMTAANATAPKPSPDAPGAPFTMRSAKTGAGTRQGIPCTSTPKISLPPLPAVAVPEESTRTSLPAFPGPHPKGACTMPPIPQICVPDDFETTSRTLAEEPSIPSLFIESRDDVLSPASVPSMTTARPSMPSIAVNDNSVPANAVKEQAASKKHPYKQSARPLPVPRQAPALGSRPVPHHAATSPFPHVAKPQHTPSVRRNAALCAHCALPISGRILSAAGERFHPECFACHQCGTNLECVAFYPEPDQKHYERIARIQQRVQGLEVSVPQGMDEEDMQRLEDEDGDESLRFFCHLDFHELFSPRCKSCKTPIEGEVVVACGSEWHVGHFFCAQCGDVSHSYFMIYLRSFTDIVSHSMPAHPLWKRRDTHGVWGVTRIATVQSAENVGSQSQTSSSMH